MANKKIAIVCDNYKLSTFLKTLKEQGFKNVSSKPTVNGPLSGTTTICVKTDESNIQKVNAVCIKVETHFKRQN